jgi:hypothetical protein
MASPSMPATTTTSEEAGTGWLLFAAIILIFTGVMRIIDSIWALRFKGSLPDNLEAGVLGTNIKTYGIVYLIVGVLLVLAGFYVLSRNQFFRWVGVVAGGLGALTGVVWLPYFPVWGAIYIALGVLVAYGLVAHGARDAA